MISFRNDYSEGACPEILEALAGENFIQNPGYGMDKHCFAAQQQIRQLCACPKAQVHFLVGGTPCNLVAITAFLRPHQAVIAAETGHVAVHETGAIEGAGHKVCTAPVSDGKLTPALIRAVVAAHPDEHMVQPKMVYLSNSTELGTVYTKQELLEIREVCNQLGLWLYLDGARLGSALTSADCGLDWKDLAELTDAFYIGGTKNGALFGEAMVVVNPALQPDFRYIEKQRGGMLAKGWLIGLQFEVLLKDGLYLRLASHANQMAARLKQGFVELGGALFADSSTNQQFFILPQATVERLEQAYSFEVWQKLPQERTAVRFVCSWATRPEWVEALLSDLARLGVV